MDTTARDELLQTDIPHRVRVCLAIPRPGLQALGSPAFPEDLKSQGDPIAWRCATDAIWEGRLAAMRWLIEFIGVQKGRNGNPAERRLNKVEFPHDVRIDELGAQLFDIGGKPDEARQLADFWDGASKGGSHATKGSGHASVDEEQLERCLKIVLNHLGQTIYPNQAWRQWVFRPC